MTYLVDILSKNELKEKYRRLAFSYHPDKGGCTSIMQKINEEYSILQDGFNTKPNSLRELKIGHTIYVNNSECVVTDVDRKLFKAKSLATKREAYFDKSTGYGLFNFKIRANIYCN